MGTLREDLAAEAEEVRETHISWVFLHAREALKVKKPVDLGFLDFRTIAQRRAACEAEVTLNARFSPDVYLGVVPVTRDAQGRHAVGGEGEVVDHAVRMRRLPDAERADLLLARRALEEAHVDAIGARVAAMHQDCRADAQTAAFGAPEAIAVNVRENFDQTRASIEAFLSRDEAHEIERWQLSFLDDEGDRFRERAAEGRVRDGHGDLRLEHFYLPIDGSPPVVLDCIEFNDRFRYGDVCADLAFLSMDLAHHRRVDLAERLLAVYARETSDFGLYAVVDFYEGYRAWVRGKIAAMAAAREDLPDDVRRRASDQARRYFLLALAAERPPVAPPAVIAIGGGLATGKSTLAERLTGRLGGPAINSDRIRKHLLGARATDRLYEGSWAGAYDPEFTARVYSEVRRLAGVVLRSGRPVLLDASFRSASMRRDARDLAAEHGVPFRFVECTAPDEVCRERLRERERGASVSDGRLAIYDDFRATWEAVTELDPDEHVVVDTTRAPEQVAASLARRLPAWPAGLSP